MGSRLAGPVHAHAHAHARIRMCMYMHMLVALAGRELAALGLHIHVSDNIRSPDPAPPSRTPTPCPTRSGRWGVHTCASGPRRAPPPLLADGIALELAMPSSLHAGPSAASAAAASFGLHGHTRLIHMDGEGIRRPLTRTGRRSSADRCRHTSWRRCGTLADLQRGPRSGPSRGHRAHCTWPFPCTPQT